MDWVDLFASTLVDLAWPLVALVALGLLREPLLGLVRALLDKPSGRIEIMRFKAEWDALQNQTEAGVRKAAEQAGEDPTEVTTDGAAALDYSNLRLIAFERPKHAVVAAGQLFQFDLRNQLGKNRDFVFDGMRTDGLADWGFHRGVFNQELADSIKNIDRMVTLILVHDQPITMDQANEVITWAEVVSGLVSDAIKRFGDRRLGVPPDLDQ